MCRAVHVLSCSSGTAVPMSAWLLGSLGVNGSAGTWWEHVSPNCLLPSLPQSVVEKLCWIKGESIPFSQLLHLQQDLSQKWGITIWATNFLKLCFQESTFHWYREGSGVACSQNLLGLGAAGYKALLSHLMAFFG